MSCFASVWSFIALVSRFRKLPLPVAIHLNHWVSFKDFMPLKTTIMLQELVSILNKSIHA